MIYKELEKLGIVIKKFDIETLFDNEIHKQRYKELVDRGELKMIGMLNHYFYLSK